MFITSHYIVKHYKDGNPPPPPSSNYTAEYSLNGLLYSELPLQITQAELIWAVHGSLSVSCMKILDTTGLHNLCLTLIPILNDR
jgi:hypothetical protein